MVPGRVTRIFATVMLSLSLLMAVGSYGSGHKSAMAGGADVPTINPRNFVNNIGARLAGLEMLVGDDVKITEAAVQEIGPQCDHSSARIKSVANDLMTNLKELESEDGRKLVADRLLTNIDSSMQECSCYAGYIKAVGVNWGGFVNDLTAMSGKKRPQSTWTCNVRDSAAYADRPAQWRR